MRQCGYWEEGNILDAVMEYNEEEGCKKIDNRKTGTAILFPCPPFGFVFFAE